MKASRPVKWVLLRGVITPRNLLAAVDGLRGLSGDRGASAVVKRYRTIVADPPWPYPDGFGERVNHPHRQDRDLGVIGMEIERRQLPYDAMTPNQISALPVPSLAADDCRLFLWATNRYLPAAISMLLGWGFTYKQLIVWDKTPNFNPLSGSVAATAAEFLVVGVRGKPARLSVWATSVIRARKARTAHSAKPDVFLDFAEQVSPGPYLELFARRDRLGWDTWGDESLETVTLLAEDAEGWGIPLPGDCAEEVNPSADVP